MYIVTILVSWNLSFGKVKGTGKTQLFTLKGVNCDWDWYSTNGRGIENKCNHHIILYLLQHYLGNFNFKLITLIISVL